MAGTNRDGTNSLYQQLVPTVGNNTQINGIDVVKIWLVPTVLVPTVGTNTQRNGIDVAKIWLVPTVGINIVGTSQPHFSHISECWYQQCRYLQLVPTLREMA